MRKLSICFVLLCLFLAVNSYAVTHEWTRQLGTTADDRSHDVNVDRLGNVYITGFTLGDLGGPNVGSGDAFVSKYDTLGNLLWTEQLGSTSFDASYGVSADGLGNVYITGDTSGDLGGTNDGSYDAFVSRYDTLGNLLWTEQLGSTSLDRSGDVSADGHGVYITGYTEGDLGDPNAGVLDAFVSKYDQAGTLLWTEQIGSTSFDLSSGVSADGLGNVYISGYTTGDLGGPNSGSYDAFVSKYNQDGTLLWTEQLGSTNRDVSWGVSADGLGNVYISGNTEGDLGGPNIGSEDVFVSKYDASGNLLWTEQLGSTKRDYGFSVNADGLGNVYISGTTFGDLGGSKAGSEDVFVSKYDTLGNLLWTEQFGSSNRDESFGVSADGQGNVYITGLTGGNLGGPNAGVLDAFLVKYSDPIPDPVPGDFDGNGVIDATDYNLWFTSYGISLTAGTGADGNGDGIVNAADYNIWRDAFEMSSSIITVAIPEPSTLLLGTLAAVGITMRRPV